MTPPPTLVLFSGGRDSSLAACLLARKGQVHLLTCDNGVSIGSDLSEYRHQELCRVLGPRLTGRTLSSTMGLFRRIALESIEQDFAKYEKNLIVLGSQLAIHTEAVVHCLMHGNNAVASGFTSYQNSFAEQMPAAIDKLKTFFESYDLEYITPVLSYASADEVKFSLLDFGVSTKSLESVSIFADTFTTPSPEIATAYIDAKLDTCRNYIELKTLSRTGGRAK